VLLLCAEIEKTYSELASRGVDFKQEPKKMPWGTYAIFVDPDGNEFIVRG
jgi:predicted enzyme related to lactoylglutathione lyase